MDKNEKFVQNLLGNLTDEQKQFVEFNNGNALVSASAGSGKTSTMIKKLVFLLVYYDVEIEDLLKSLRNLLNQKERASLNVMWLTEKMADAQLELRKAEEQIKKAKKDLEDAQLAVSSINAKLQEAEKEEDESKCCTV